MALAITTQIYQARYDEGLLNLISIHIHFCWTLDKYRTNKFMLESTNLDAKFRFVLKNALFNSCVCMHVCMYACVDTHTSKHTSRQTLRYVHTYLHTHRQTDKQTNIHTYILTYAYTNIQTCKHASMQAYNILAHVVCVAIFAQVGIVISDIIIGCRQRYLGHHHKRTSPSLSRTSDIAIIISDIIRLHACIYSIFKLAPLCDPVPRRACQRSEPCTPRPSCQWLLRCKWRRLAPPAIESLQAKHPMLMLQASRLNPPFSKAIAAL